jgi:hypothetical protein
MLGKRLYIIYINIVYMFPSGTIVNTDLLFPKISSTSIAPIRPMENPPPPSTPSGYDIKVGKVDLVLNKDVVIVSYFAGGKDQMKNVGKPNHGFSNGQSVFVITKPAPDHSFVSVEAVKPVEGLVPVPNPANDVKTGKVTAVTNKDTVTVSYFAAGKNQTKTVTKENHGFKVGENVYVTITPPPGQVFLGVSAITAPASPTPRPPAPVPAPVPKPTPAPRPVPGPGHRPGRPG